jgi:SNF2 family DNA or RNA helicase
MNVIVSKTHKTLVVPKIPAICNLFPEAPVFDTDRVLLPHRLHEYKLLKHLGIDAPHPMLTYYDWAGGAPYEVQRATCAMLTENPRAYVLNALGCGKTASALWAWDYLYGNKLVGKLLVDAPLSTLWFVWAAEVLKRLPHRRVSVLHGSKKKRLEKLDEDADIYIVNHDGLATIAEPILARTDINALVLDELAVFRNQSDRSKLMRKFAQRFATVWGMTGAPLPNAPTDCWAQCRIITPNTVPQYFKTTREMLMTKVSQFKYTPKPDAVKIALGMMKPAVRFTLTDVVELPDVSYRTMDIELSAKQKYTYKKLVAQLKVMLTGGTITAMNAGVALNKLLQISGGWCYTSNPAYVGLDPHLRINTLLELINEAPDKVLVFAPFRHTVEELSKVLAGQKEPIEHFTIHGDVDSNERARIFNSFQHEQSIRVLLAHPQCLAHGVTLTAASTILWYSPITSLEIFEQACARIRRIGQKNKQQIIMLQGSPVEKRVYGLLRNKQKLQDQFLALVEEATNAN